MLAQTQAEMMNRLKGVGSMADNAAFLLRSENRAKLAASLGMSVEQFDQLTGMRTGATPRDAELALAKLGLAQQNADGSITMTKEGRSLLKAVNSGNVDDAEQAKSDAHDKANKKAKAEAKGGGSGDGKKPEPTGSETIAKLSDRIQPQDYDALKAFQDGAALPPEAQTDLAQAGLIEIDPDGVSIMTSNGRRLINAAKAGDVRTASDILSAAKQAVAKKQTAADEKRVRAAQYQANADAAYPDAEKRAASIGKQANDLAKRTQRRVDGYAKQLDKDSPQVEAYAAAANEHEIKANELDGAVQATILKLEQTTDPTERATLSNSLTVLERQRDGERKNAQDNRDRATEAESRLIELQDKIEAVITDANTKTESYWNNSQDILKAAEDRANEWKAKADKDLQGADDLELSIGGGAPPATKAISSPNASTILSRTWKQLQSLIFKPAEKRETIAPQGLPLPAFEGDTVFMTADDIEESIRSWNTDVPEAAGMLTPRKATLVEIAEQIATGRFND